MKVTRNAVSKLVEEELKMANERYPLFHSDHEGLAVMEEEVFELTDEYTSLCEALYDLRTDIYTDEDDEKKKVCAGQITLIATELACEAIQVAAMGYKFNASIIERKELQNG